MNIQEIKSKYNHLVIPCSSTKLDQPSRADLFYCGAGYFSFQLRLAKKIGIPFSILSTRYGLIDPAYICEPYDMIWCKKIQQNNRGMRGKDIPIATEQHRVSVSLQATQELIGKSVLCFCSVQYMSYFPDWDFFNEIEGRGVNSSNKGLMFVVQRLSELIKELE